MPDKTPFDDLVKQFQSEQAAAALLGFAHNMADYFHALLESKLTRAEALHLTIALLSLRSLYLNSVRLPRRR